MLTAAKQGIERAGLVSMASVVVILVGLSHLLAVLSNLLIPLVVAIFIWFLLNALIHVVERIKIRGIGLPRFLSATLSLVLVFGLLSLVINVVTTNLGQVAKEAPFYQEKLVTMIEKAYAYFDVEEPPTLDRLIGQISFRDLIRGLAVSLTGIIGSAGLILVYVIFLFLEQGSFKAKIEALAGNPKRQKDWENIMRRMGADIRRYVGIKTLASLLTGVMSYLVMRVIGIDFPFFWAFLIFLLNFIPTIGSIIATAFPTIVSLVQFESFQMFLMTGLCLTSIQVTIGNFVEPRLMGDTLNLSPLVILFSLAYWSFSWGIFGAFLCVPLTVVVMIIFSNFGITRPIAILASRAGAVQTLEE
ncbi:MAG: AI-2E family transporter [Puniceicoccaceae bacterium]